MKFRLTILALAFAACTHQAPTSSVKAEGKTIGNLKGYQGLTQVFRSRIVTPESAFDLGWFVDGSLSTSPDGFRSLLGSYQGAPGQAVYRNGAPNAINMMLWDLILSRAASDLGSACSQTEVVLPFIGLHRTGSFGLTVKLKDSLVPRLTAACAWSDDAEGRRVILQKLWYGLMGFEAPASELDAFIAYFGGVDSPVATMTSSERVRVLIRAIFLNPHFLLEA